MIVEALHTSFIYHACVIVCYDPSICNYLISSSYFICIYIYIYIHKETTHIQESHMHVYRCDVDLGVREQTKRKLRIWEVSIGLLVKERGEKEIACIDNIKTITIYLVSLITIVFSSLLLFAFDKISLIPLMPFDRITHPPFIHEEGGCMSGKCYPCIRKVDA